MAAYAEGLSILQKANIGRQQREADAETTPLRDPEYYRYDFDTAAVAEVWRRGSVISSWLLDLTAEALADEPGLESFTGGSRTQVKAAGRCWPLSTRGCRPTCSRRRCSPASRLEARVTSPTASCRPCARNSADTRKSRPVDRGPPPHPNHRVARGKPTPPGHRGTPSAPASSRMIRIEGVRSTPVPATSTSTTPRTA